MCAQGCAPWEPDSHAARPCRRPALTTHAHGTPAGAAEQAPPRCWQPSPAPDQAGSPPLWTVVLTPKLLGHGSKTFLFCKSQTPEASLSGKMHTAQPLLLGGFLNPPVLRSLGPQAMPSGQNSALPRAFSLPIKIPGQTPPSTALGLQIPPP